MSWVTEIQASVQRGQNAGRAPGLIGQDQFAFARNVSTRGSRPRRRSCWVRRKTLYTGLPQGFHVFGLAGEILISLSGRIVTLNTRNWEMRQLTDETTRNSDGPVFAYFCETEGSVVIQDGQSYPYVRDPSGFRRFTPEDGDTLPIGTAMAYGSGRLSVAVGDGSVVRIGDARGSEHQSELLFTETSRLLGGGDLAFPAPVRAMAHVPIVDTSSGKGPLLVGLERRLYAVKTNNPSRDTWASTEDFVTDVFHHHGIAGPYAHAQVNQDVYFRAIDGLRSVRLTIADYQSAGATPLSREVANRLDLDTEWMLDGCSVAYFDNRLFVTHSPYLLENRRVIHQGVIALNFDEASELGAKAPPAYDGEWTGPAIAQLAAGEIDGERRLFALCREGDANSIWEFLPERTPRIDTSSGVFPQDDPEAELHTRVYYCGNGTELKALQKMRFWFSELRGFAKFSAYFRAEGATSWTLLDTFRFQSATSTFEAPLPAESRGPVDTVLASDATDTDRQRPVNVGNGFQLKFVWCGQLRVEYWQVFADPIAEFTVAENRDEATDLSAIDCGDALPDDPVSTTPLPVLEVFDVNGEEVGDTIDGAALGGVAKAFLLNLVNSGGNRLTISSYPASGGFIIFFPLLVQYLDPGESASLTIRQTGASPTTGTLTITTNDADSPRVINLTG